MNCQDISRLVDVGNIRNLSAAERSAADAHARSCRECAAIWGVQSRLATLRVPATPPQVAARLQMLAALPTQATRGNLPRRLTLIGSVVAMAAAAALLTVRQADTPVVESPVPAVAVSAAVEPVLPAATEPVAPAVVEHAAPAGEASRQPAKPLPPLPLLPPPVDMLAGRTQQFNQAMSQIDMALQKAAELHPELVEGAEIDGTFVVGIALKTDGSVVTSAVRHAPPGDAGTARAEIATLIPGDGGAVATRPKSTRLRDGRMLRAEAVVTLSIIPEGFDLARSRVRVLQILGDKYAYLMAPASNGEINRVEVFLSDSGSILRERVDVARQGDSGTSVTSDPADIARFAEGMAERLGLQVAQIGVVGLTGATQRVELPVRGPAGAPATTQAIPRMLINYAWQRRAGESAPALSGAAPPQAVDQAVALAIVERYIPDAFTALDPASGQPAILLSASGEFIRAARLPPQASRLVIPQKLREQLAASAPLNPITRLTLTNAAGVSTEVYFAWERSTAAPAGFATRP